MFRGIVEYDGSLLEGLSTGGGGGHSLGGGGWKSGGCSSTREGEP